MLKSKYEIGRFDRKITLMQPVSVASVSGGPKFSGFEEIASDATPWAMVKNKLGGEVVQNDEITHIQQSIFTIRYRTDIDLNVRIVHENKMYAIHSFAESGETRRRFLDITAEYVEEYVIT